MIDQQLPGIGHNMPPIEERIEEEVAPLAARQTAMLEIARRAVIIDDAGAGKVNDLAIQIRTLEKQIEQARDAQLRPYLDACGKIRGRYDPLIRALNAAHDGLRAMLTAHVRRREAEAEAERARVTAEQRQREEEAAAARRAADAAREAGKGTVGAELAALKAEEEAGAAQQRAEAVRPVPIRSTLGQVGTIRSIAFDIIDLRLLLGWAMKQPLKTVLEAEARKLIGAYLRQLGVDAVERGIQIPGVRSWVEKSAASRR